MLAVPKNQIEAVSVQTSKIRYIYILIPSCPSNSNYWLTLNFLWILFQLTIKAHVIHIRWYRGLQGSWRESVPYWTSRWLPATGIVSLSPGRRRGWKVLLLCVIGFCFFPTDVVLKLCKYIYIYDYIWCLSSRCICQSSLCVQMHIIYIHIHLNLYEFPWMSVVRVTPRPLSWNLQTLNHQELCSCGVSWWTLASDGTTPGDVA